MMPYTCRACPWSASESVCVQATEGMQGENAVLCWSPLLLQRAAPSHAAAPYSLCCVSQAGGTHMCATHAFSCDTDAVGFNTHLVHLLQLLTAACGCPHHRPFTLSTSLTHTVCVCVC
jgi:hypothetical protein